MRQKGYQRALVEVGISEDKSLIAQADSFSQEDSLCKMREIYNSAAKFTAIFAHSDLMAITAMEASLERGFKIPEDISVMGFDDTYASLTFPKLSTLRMPMYDVGVRAAQILLKRISSSSSKRRPIRDNIIPEFVERESTRNLV